MANSQYTLHSKWRITDVLKTWGSNGGKLGVPAPPQVSCHKPLSAIYDSESASEHMLSTEGSDYQWIHGQNRWAAYCQYNSADVGWTAITTVRWQPPSLPITDLGDHWRVLRMPRYGHPPGCPLQWSHSGQRGRGAFVLEICQRI